MGLLDGALGSPDLLFGRLGVDQLDLRVGNLQQRPRLIEVERRRRQARHQASLLRILHVPSGGLHGGLRTGWRAGRGQRGFGTLQIGACGVQRGTVVGARRIVLDLVHAVARGGDLGLGLRHPLRVRLEGRLRLVELRARLLYSTVERCRIVGGACRLE